MVLAEDRARAGVYGLLASLFYSPPTAQFLRDVFAGDILDDGVPESRLVSAWRSLRDAMRTADPAAIQQEYDDNFIGTGRAPVFLYASHYLSGSVQRTPLNELREELAQLGITLKRTSFETEDHISALCDVMRFLIVGEEPAPPALLEAQRDFFMRHIAPSYVPLCSAIVEAGGTDFYKKVARFAEEFFSLELQSFDIA